MRLPTVVVRPVGEDREGVRFSHIGNRQRFKVILQRFRFDFPLAAYEELDEGSWWIIATTQHSELTAFADRNGLRIVQE